MYESFYNFTEPPFRLTPDPRFYFSSATHKRALTHLRFGFHQREGFVVITGKPGTGKTELMLHLLDGLPEDRIRSGKIVTSNLDANEILQQVAAVFHIPVEGFEKAVLLKKMEEVFLQHLTENKRFVLIVDEAHNLSSSSLNELQMLTNFQLGGKSALQCFLSGQDSLKSQLQSPELQHLKQRVITSTFLTPLEKHETPEYIEHRLRCVGWEGDPKINQSAYTQIHSMTEGIPRQINALCNRILWRAYAEQKHYIDEGIIRRAVDDAQLEPLVSDTLPDQAGAQSMRMEPHQLPQHAGQANTAFTFAEHNQNNTLLPGAADSVVYPGQHSPGYGDHARELEVSALAKNNDEDGTDEAGKMSDALSEFHAETSESNINTSSGNTDQALAMVPPTDQIQKAETKSPRVSARVYGAMSLLITVGVAIWIYSVSDNDYVAESVKTPIDHTAVATGKELPPEVSDITAGDQPFGQNKEHRVVVITTEPVDSATMEQVASFIGHTPTLPSQQLATADTDASDLTEHSPPSKDNSQERPVDQGMKLAREAEGLPPVSSSDSSNPLDRRLGALATIAGKKSGVETGEEQIQVPSDKGSLGENAHSGASGAKGGRVDQQAEQQRPLGEEDIAASEFPTAELNDKVVKTPASASQQASKTQTSKKSLQAKSPAGEKSHQSQSTAVNAERTVKHEPAVANVVNASEENKPPISKPHRPESPATKNQAKTQPKPVEAPIHQTPAPATMATTISPAAKAIASDAAAKEQSPPERTVKPNAPSPHTAGQVTPIEALVQIESTAEKALASSGARAGMNTASSTKTAVIINTAQVSSDVGRIPDGKAEAGINKAPLNELLLTLTTAYEDGNLNQLLSVLSKDVRGNDGSTRHQLKSGYRKLFDITDMRRMTITSINWSRKKRLIHGEGEFKLSVREKGANKITSYGGIISLDVNNKPGGAVITKLNYEY